MYPPITKIPFLEDEQDVVCQTKSIYPVSRCNSGRSFRYETKSFIYEAFCVYTILLENENTLFVYESFRRVETTFITFVRDNQNAATPSELQKTGLFDYWMFKGYDSGDLVYMALCTQSVDKPVESDDDADYMAQQNNLHSRPRRVD